MENLQVKKYIKIFGRLIFWIFLLSGLCRIFLRDYYSRENHDFILLVLLGLSVIHLIFSIRYDKEEVLENMNSRINQVKKYWPEILIIVLMVVFIVFYRKNLS